MRSSDTLGSAEVRRAPGPRGAAALAGLITLGTDRLAFLDRLASRHGDLAEFRLGRRRFFFVNHPRLVRHVLVDRESSYRKGLGLREADPLFGNGLLTSEGTAWSQQRNLLQPCLSKRALESAVPAMTAEIAAAIEAWNGIAGPQRRLDIAAELKRLTFRVAGRLLFGTDITPWYGTAESALARALEATSGLMMGTWDVRAAHHRRRLGAAVEELRRVAGAIVDGRRASPAVDDLLGALLRAAGPDPASERQLIDQVVTFLVIGHETTACALAWTWYELLRHPDVQARVDDEIRDLIGERAPVADDLARLTVTRQVLEESIRLHPPVWLLPREAIHADDLDGVPVPPGSGVLVSVYTLHRHPDFWRAPLVFDPSRFELRDPCARPSFVYLPFGAGARGCVGGALAMMEAMAALVLVIQRYRVVALPGARIRARPLLTLRLDPCLPVRIEQRERNARWAADAFPHRSGISAHGPRS